MTRPKDAAGVRSKALAVILAYALPLVATVAYVAAFGLGSPLGGISPGVVFFGFIALGVAQYLGRAVASLLRRKRGSRPTELDEPHRLAILREFPEFQPLKMLLTDEASELVVNRSTLRIGYVRLARAGAGGGRMTDALFLALAHETRHVEVGVGSLVGVFRFLQAIYVANGISVYTSLLLTVMAFADGPNRVAFISYAFLLPYISALFRAVLDEALAAFEWTLELDADAFAQARCRRVGRTSDASEIDWSPTFLRHADGHPPPLLRQHAMSSGLIDRRTLRTTLTAAWLVAVVPLAMEVLIGVTDTTRPELYNSLLGLAASILLAGAAATLLAAARPWTQTHGVSRIPAAMFVMRLQSLVTGTLAIIVPVFVAVVLLMNLRALLATGSLLEADVIATPPLLVLAALYVQAYRRAWDLRWMAGGALADCARLFAIAWLLMASGALPFFNDAPALGAAIRDYPWIIGYEMKRLWLEEPDKVAVAFLASAALSAIGYILGSRALLRWRRSHSRRSRSKRRGKRLDVRT